MHIFVNGKELKSALEEFNRAGIKEAVICATSSRSIELSGFLTPAKVTGAVVKLWVSVPLSRDTEFGECEPVRVKLNVLHGIPTGEVEIEACCLGFFVNHAATATADCPSATAHGMQSLDWDNCHAVSVKPKDCRAVAWVMRAMASDDGPCDCGFDRICIRDGVAEATDGHRAHRANVSFGSPEMLVHAVMADLISRQPGTLNFRADEAYEYAEYRAGSIRMETVCKKATRWPDLERVMPYGAPSVELHAVYVLEHVKDAVNGFRSATVRLSAVKGKRELIVDGNELCYPMAPPFDKLAMTGETRREAPVLYDPWPSKDFCAEYNAAYLVDALAGFSGCARMHYAGDESPLVLTDETGRAAIITPIA